MNSNDTDTTVLQFRISRATAAQIEQLAQTTGQDQSQLAEQALRQYVAFEAEQLAKIHEGIADADAGRFVSREEVESIANRYRAYRAQQAG
jgi:RHH-type transcriptional regulator, rel operon repressor / antitoxin RelB